MTQCKIIVELPFPAEDVIKGIDMVMISHLHQDHFENMGRNMGRSCRTCFISAFSARTSRTPAYLD